MLWDELDNNIHPIPDDYATFKYIKTQADSARFFDVDSTKDNKETKSNIITNSFLKTVEIITKLKEENIENLQWYRFKKTTVSHLLQLIPFSKTNIKIGGNSHIINACTPTHGPSWRMIISMKKNNPVGLGVYPGGQSGNPGSKYYDNMMSTWANGDYYDLNFYKPEEINNYINKATQIIIFK
jgi:penicillin amidase